MNLTAKVGGLPGWQWVALAAIGLMGLSAYHRYTAHATTTAVGVNTSDAHTLLIVQSPQTVTPYNMPVTRAGSVFATDLNLPVAVRA